MERWEVCLLGTPRAVFGNRSAQLRTRLTWAVFASLLLPGIEGASNEWVEKADLIQRFWPDTDHGRVSLRLALKSLRDTFGADHFQTDGSRVRIHSEGFCLDLERIAQVRDTDEPDVLRSIEDALHGEFLQGCDDPEGSVVRWIGGERARWNTTCAALLQRLADSLEREGNRHAAFDALCRSLRYAPDSPDVWQSAWRLARAIGRTSDADALNRNLTMGEAIARIRRREAQEHRLTLAESRAFDEILEKQVALLGPRQRQMLERLSVFEAPFSASLAHQIARCSLTFLQSQCNTGLLDENDDGRFFLSPTVRESLWKRLHPVIQTRLRLRLHRVIVDWHDHPDTQSALPLFRDPTESASHISALITWLTSQAATERSLAAVLDLVRLTFTGLDMRLACPFLENAIDTSLPEAMRFAAAFQAGAISQEHLDFPTARRCLTRSLLLSNNPSHLATSHFHLACVCHHSELFAEALHHCQACIDLGRALPAVGNNLHALRLSGEILRAEGRLVESLEVLEEAWTGAREHLSDPLQWQSSAFSWESHGRRWAVVRLLARTWRRL